MGYDKCDCSAQRSELTSGDTRLVVHCLRLNDYRRFSEPGGKDPYDPKGAELYRSVHGGQPQWMFDGLRAVPVGAPQVQRLFSPKGRAPQAAAWNAAYLTALASGKPRAEAIAAGDAATPSDPNGNSVLGGAARVKAPATPKPVVLDANGVPVPEAPEVPKHHAYRFIGLAERAVASAEKLVEGISELYRLNPPTPTPDGTVPGDGSRELHKRLNDCILAAQDAVDAAKCVGGFLLTTPDTLRVEAPKIEPVAGGYAVIREKLWSEFAEQLGVEDSTMSTLQLLILSVAGGGAVLCDPESPIDKVFAASGTFTVISEPTAEGISEAERCRAAKRVRRAI